MVENVILPFLVPRRNVPGDSDLSLVIETSMSIRLGDTLDVIGSFRDTHPCLLRCDKTTPIKGRNILGIQGLKQ